MTEIENAYWWVKTYCPHMATPQSDQQTTERMTESVSEAKHHLAILDKAGLVEWNGFKPKGKGRPRNFFLKPLPKPGE